MGGEVWFGGCGPGFMRSWIIRGWSDVWKILEGNLGGDRILRIQMGQNYMYTLFMNTCVREQFGKEKCSFLYVIYNNCIQTRMKCCSTFKIDLLDKIAVIKNY